MVLPAAELWAAQCIVGRLAAAVIRIRRRIFSVVGCPPRSQYRQSAIAASAIWYGVGKNHCDTAVNYFWRADQSANNRHIESSAGCGPHRRPTSADLCNLASATPIKPRGTETGRAVEKGGTFLFSLRSRANGKRCRERSVMDASLSKFRCEPFVPAARPIYNNRPSL